LLLETGHHVAILLAVVVDHLGLEDNWHFRVSRSRAETPVNVAEAICGALVAARTEKHILTLLDERKAIHSELDQIIAGLDTNIIPVFR